MMNASFATEKGGRIAIAGAGIGGLALALALARGGFEPVVLEKRTEAQVRGEGAFLSLAPNGINALRAHGLAEAAIAAGVRTSGLAMFNEHGRRVAFMDYGRYRDRFGAPCITIRRGALESVLADAAAAAGIAVRYAAEVDVVEVRPDEVVIGGERFDALVACDGLRSTIRSRIFPELPQPRYTGLIGTGGFVDAPGVRPTGGAMNMTFGKRAFFGYIAEPGWPVMWFNTYPAPESEAGPIGDAAAYARFIESLHRDDPLDNARILAAVPAIGRNYPIYDMAELPYWSRGRVLLMGDAAHAVAPHAGQGAAMAIEDALVLAAVLEAEESVEAAFARFFQLRRERTQKVIRIGRMAGSPKHAQSWLALRLRDLLLPLVIPLAVRSQEAVFAFRADRTPLALPRQ